MKELHNSWVVGRPILISVVKVKLEFRRNSLEHDKTNLIIKIALKQN